MKDPTGCYVCQSILMILALHMITELELGGERYFVANYFFA